LGGHKKDMSALIALIEPLVLPEEPNSQDA
jgi:hypothetical protein